jgi:hypothetical protein
MRISVCEGIKAKLLAAGPDGLLGGKFVAVHESATGTKRTDRDICLFVRFRSKADIGQ